MLRLTRRVCSSRLVAGSLRALSSTPAVNSATQTHTGQDYSADDPRNVRFEVTGVKKQVNAQWAIDLIDKTPVIKVKSNIVACDGGGGALGHPKVYINLDDNEVHSCIYCGLRYQREHDEEEEDKH
eukprot:TRINITY_DN228_c0_g1_i1.p1 TRINITY_DN228_c0_g1~~TRINITY_DN228_c0_g1_i1.p1  ORF type:complete len:135 (-),score=40.30 TRINITY_DN228_c0_g1_i1:22-399(-)